MTPNWDDLKPAAPNWDDLKPADGGLSDIRAKAIAALPEHMQETARAALSQLAPSWQHNDASYSPYRPAQPNNMPNDAINPVGTDTQMAAATAAAGGAALGARALARPPPPPPQPPVNMGQMPTQQATQMIRNTGGAPSSPIGGTPPPLQAAGQAAQASFLGQKGKTAPTPGGPGLGLSPWGTPSPAAFSPKIF